MCWSSARARSTSDGSADKNNNNNSNSNNNDSINNNTNTSNTNNDNRMSVRLWLRQLGRVFVGLLGLRVDLKGKRLIQHCFDLGVCLPPSATRRCVRIAFRRIFASVGWPMQRGVEI